VQVYQAKNEKPEKAPKLTKKAPPPGLSKNAAAIYGVLERVPKSADEISDLTNLPSSAVAVGLTELELLGLIVPASGRRFVIA
jgi:predicted Rossmann fold nucleotide-binding protein DprA/Smf involved in DNA uptake